ncbi:MAG: DUF4446 family protein [Solirubrobacterales bacterium]|nr:DUF4446 family protein [Solirubrobacterales bacterium]
MDGGLSSTEGAVALAGVAIAVVALVLAIVLAVKLRRLRAAQRAVLGEDGTRDLVGHAARLERGFVELRDWVEETAAGIERRMAGAEERIDGCVAHRALVRYDAWGEMSGQQSSSLALLDARRSGVIVSTIHHRDSARVYVKRVLAGEADVELSPEERQAVEEALAGDGAAGG